MKKISVQGWSAYFIEETTLHHCVIINARKKPSQEAVEGHETQRLILAIS